MSEEALWNNSFYSSSAHISQSSSANHISTLRKSVAISHSVSSNSIAAGVLDANTEHEVLNQRTSVMSASPSMKALESILNEKKTAPRRPEAIEEEGSDDDEDNDTTSEGDTPPSALTKPPFSNSAYTYGNASGSRVSLVKPAFDASVSTFHTAPSVESATWPQDDVVPEITHSHKRNESPTHRYSSSISTMGESGYSVGTPKLDPPAAFYSVKRTGKDYSPKLLTVSAPEIQRGSVSSDQETTAVEDTPVATNYHAYSSGAPAASVTTLPQGQSFRETKELPKPPSQHHEDEIDPIAKDPVYSSPQRPIKSLIDLDSSPQMTSTPALSLQPPFKPTRASQAPQSASADAFSAPPRPLLPKKNSAPASSPSQTPQALPGKAKYSGESQKWPSSSFATPRLSPQRHHSSPSLNDLDAITKRSPGAHKRSNTMGDIAAMNKPEKQTSTPRPLSKKSATSAEVLPTPGAGASKRFSFRGLFKIKSKQHSLSKDLDEMEPSRPSKLKSRSQSSPAFSTLANSGPIAEENEELNDQAKKRQSKNLFGGFKRKKSEANITVPEPVQETKKVQAPVKQNVNRRAEPVEEKRSNPQPSPLPKASSNALTKPQTPHAPVSPGSFDEMDTPATDTLEPAGDREAQTIREVDDSDYNYEYTNNGDDENDDEQELNLANDPPQPHANKKYGEELTLEPTPHLNLPEFGQNGRSFGSPLLKIDFSESTPKSSETPGPSNRSSMNPPRNDQLIGEALFPKSLSAHEIESIVSLERSRSMKSVRSNGKRSSFINYSGEDENVIVYSGEAGRNSPTTLRRSGSILKNSQSISSLKGVVQSIDETVAKEQLPSPIEYQETDFFVGQSNDEDYSAYMDFNSDFDGGNLNDFIEFSDFIDVDNLEFPTSPVQESQSPPSIVESTDLNSSLYELSGYANAIATGSADPEMAPPHNINFDNKPSVNIVSEDAINGPAKESLSQSKQLHSTIPQIVSEDTNRENTYNGPIQPPMINGSSKSQEHDDSNNTQESEVPSLIIVEERQRAPQESQEQAKQDSEQQEDAISKSPILETAYKMAMNEAVAQRSPKSVARPISMSFKGFKGPAISKQAMRKNGSHQSLNMYDSSNESSAVGQGFGSSDDESDGEIYSSDEELENDFGSRFTGVAKQSAQEPGLKTTGNLANRGTPSPKSLGLQPPNGPFYHDRIPSLSDQSAASSPKSLTSFISRIKKSPSASPKVQYKTGGVRFSSRIILYDTYNGDDYDRHPDIATCNQLTPLLAQQIREELNEVKSQMEVHQDSQCYTHFF